MWTMDLVDNDKYVFSFEGKRNLIVCSYSRLEEFQNASSELVATKDFEVKCYNFVSHNKVYIADSEGFVLEFDIKD